MHKYYRRLSPTTQFVIAETARVCACLSLIIIVGGVVNRNAHALFART